VFELERINHILDYFSDQSRFKIRFATQALFWFWDHRLKSGAAEEVEGINHFTLASIINLWFINSLVCLDLYWFLGLWSLIF
jgi:hypothetical protein